MTECGSCLQALDIVSPASRKTTDSRLSRSRPPAIAGPPPNSRSPTTSATSSTRRLTKALAEIATQCGLPPIRVHDLRHGLATHARAEGVEDSVLSGMLGHASKWFTTAFYGDIVNEVKRAASEKIAEHFAFDDEV